MESTTAPVVKSEKSNAPLICGIIGFVLEIPNLACNLICAGTAGLASGLANKDGKFDNAAADQALNSMGSIMLIGFLLSFLCFILCFFGKKKCALWLGIITILAALYLLGSSCIFFSVFGLGSGILFLVQGITMILNSRKC